MIVTHTFRAMGSCPLDNAKDYYKVRVTLTRFEKIEDIKAKAKACLEKPVYQEDFTQALAAVLAPARVVTECVHAEGEIVVEVETT